VGRHATTPRDAVPHKHPLHLDDRCHNIRVQHPDAVVEAVSDLLVAVDAQHG